MAYWSNHSNEISNISYASFTFIHTTVSVRHQEFWTLKSNRARQHYRLENKVHLNSCPKYFVLFSFSVPIMLALCS